MKQTITDVKIRALNDALLSKEAHGSAQNSIVYVMNHDETARLECRCSKLVEYMFYISSKLVGHWVGTEWVSEREAMMFLRGVGGDFAIEPIAKPVMETADGSD